MLKIITDRPFWANLLIALALLLLVFFIFLQSLKYFTHHGAYLKVPDVNNKNITAATDLLSKEGFEVLVQDSVYYDTLPPLTVVKQFPEPDASVKVNRTVYLTVNRAVPPVIEMPNLIGMSFRNAELELKARGLKLGDTTYQPDIAKNAVLDQLLKNSTIKPGTKITMGNTISLVLGAGIGSEEMPVPDLFAMNFEEASALLEANKIILGSVVTDGAVQDTTAAFIFRQQPARFNDDGSMNRIRQGQMIDVWLTPQKPVRKTDSSFNKQDTHQGTGGNEY